MSAKTHEHVLFRYYSTALLPKDGPALITLCGWVWASIHFVQIHKPFSHSFFQINLMFFFYVLTVHQRLLKPAFFTVMLSIAYGVTQMRFVFLELIYLSVHLFLVSWPRVCKLTLEKILQPLQKSNSNYFMDPGWCKWDKKTILLPGSLFYLVCWGSPL